MRYGIDIFSGAGGLSLGAEMAVTRISTAIEINQSAAKTFMRNHKGVTGIQDDTQDINPMLLHGKNKPVLFMLEDVWGIIYKRLRADQLSLVIPNYIKSKQIHPYEDRGISVRETA